MSTTSTTGRAALDAANGRARTPAAPPQGDLSHAELQRGGERRGYYVKRFKNLFSTCTGISFTKAELVEEGCSVLSYGQIHSKDNSRVGVNRKLIRHIPASLTTKKSLAHKGDFLFADTSEDLEGCGNCICVDTDEPIYAGSHVILARKHHEQNERFLAYEFASVSWRKQLRKLVNGVKVYSVTQSILNSVPVWLPPLPEQEAIVRYLDETTRKIDKAIAAEERLIELLQERKQIIINEAVGGDLSREEAQSRKELPKGWMVKRLKSLLVANDGGVWGDDPRGNERDMIVLRSTEQNVDGTLSVIDPAIRNLTDVERAKALLKEGDLIVTKSSGSQEHIGKTSIIDEALSKRGCCYSNFLQRLRVNGCARFFWYMLNCAITKRQFEQMATTTTGLMNLTGKLLGNLQFPIPPLAEQEAIVKRLDKETEKIDKAIEVKRRQIALLRERREIIIDEVVTGKVKVA